MHSRFKRKEKGLSLLELVIAMAIGVVVLGALSTTFILQRKRYDVQEQITAMTQSARAAMDMVIAEAMMAGYNPTGDLQDEDETNTGTFVGIDPISATHFKIYADLNGDGDNADANEIIEYEFDSANRVLKRGTGGNTPINFAEDIQGFSVTYLNLANTAETDPSKIRKVQIVIVARTEKPDGDYSANGGYRTTTLASDVKIRNMGLDTAYSGSGSTTVPASTSTTTVPVTTTTTTTVPGPTTTTTTSDSSSSSSSSTTSTSSSTTTIVSPELTLDLDACKPQGNARVYAQIRVLVNGLPATAEDGVTVTWEIVAAGDYDISIAGPWGASYLANGYFGAGAGPAPCDSGFAYYAVTPSNVKFDEDNRWYTPIAVCAYASKEGYEDTIVCIPVQIPE